MELSRARAPRNERRCVSTNAMRRWAHNPDGQALWMAGVLQAKLMPLLLTPLHLASAAAQGYVTIMLYCLTVPIVELTLLILLTVTHGGRAAGADDPALET